jgi:hypothetical protein
MNDDRPDLGICCECGAEPATTVMLLDRLAPKPGTGWGCVLCDLPSDGAVAVLCAECDDKLQDQNRGPAFVCSGFPKENNRLPFDRLSLEKFEHNAEKHMDEAYHI